ncbi:MAG: DUF3267 domain-containing protein [Acutalibacteraceae bacterium]
MKLHYEGKYNMDPASLPQAEHKPGAVEFKEAGDTKKLAVIATVISFVVVVIMLIPVVIRLRGQFGFDDFTAAWLGCLCSLLTLYPHELLHSVCFKGDVYMYTNFKQGMMFVIGTEDMSKGRFIFMSLLPTLIFGVLPFAAGMIFPKLVFLTAFGIMCASMGSGDLYNAFNALTQIPRGGRTYMSGFHSYWYMPQK